MCTCWFACACARANAVQVAQLALPSQFAARGAGGTDARGPAHGTTGSGSASNSSGSGGSSSGSGGSSSSGDGHAGRPSGGSGNSSGAQGPAYAASAWLSARTAFDAAAYSTLLPAGKIRESVPPGVVGVPAAAAADVDAVREEAAERAAARRAALAATRQGRVKLCGGLALSPGWGGGAASSATASSDSGSSRTYDSAESGSSDSAPHAARGDNSGGDDGDGSSGDDGASGSSLSDGEDTYGLPSDSSEEEYDYSDSDEENAAPAPSCSTEARLLATFVTQYSSVDGGGALAAPWRPEGAAGGNRSHSARPHGVDDGGNSVGPRAEPPSAVEFVQAAEAAAALARRRRSEELRLIRLWNRRLLYATGLSPVPPSRPRRGTDDSDNDDDDDGVKAIGGPAGGRSNGGQHLLGPDPSLPMAITVSRPLPGTLASPGSRVLIAWNCSLKEVTAVTVQVRHDEKDGVGWGGGLGVRVATMLEAAALWAHGRAHVERAPQLGWWLRWAHASCDVIATPLCAFPVATASSAPGIPCHLPSASPRCSCSYGAP
jgi:hypothetical protein